MATLAQLLSSKVRAEVFRLLFGLANGELHMREVERRSGLAYGTVRQELTNLAKLGLIQARKSGNRTYYRANTSHPLYPEIRRIVLKTDGLADFLKERLQNAGVETAFVFGSLAACTENALSDIDLMVIGTASLRQLSKMLSGAAQELGREINPHVMTVDEFLKRRGTGDHFLTTVLAGPKIFIVGSHDDLERMGKQRLAAAARQQPARDR